MRAYWILFGAWFFVGGVIVGILMTPSGLEVVSPITGYAVVSPEKASPSDWISEGAVTVDDQKVVIALPHAYWARFPNTNSMDPTLDNGANAIQIKPESADQIHIGDIITYDATEGHIIHRVREIGTDSQGWFAIVQGDNNPVADPAKVRFSQVERVVVAIVY